MDIPNPKRRLVAGLYVQVAFQLQQQRPESGAGRELWCSRAGGPKVAVVDSDGDSALSTR